MCVDCEPPVEQTVYLVCLAIVAITGVPAAEDLDTATASLPHRSDDVTLTTSALQLTFGLLVPAVALLASYWRHLVSAAARLKGCRRRGNNDRQHRQ